MSLTIRTKLLFGIGLIISIFISGNYFIYQKFVEIIDVTAELRNQSLRSQEVRQLETLLPQLSIIGSTYIQHFGEEDRNRISILVDQVHKAFNRLETLNFTNQEKHIYERMYLHFKRLDEDLSQWHLTVKRVDMSVNLVGSDRIKDDLKLVSELYSELKNSMQQEVEAAYAKAETIKTDAIYKTIAIALGVFLLGLIVAFFLIKSINNPLKKLIWATKVIADGDLEYNVEMSPKTEIGRLASSFNSMTKKLKDSQSKLSAAKHYIDSVIHSMVHLVLVIDSNLKIKKCNANLLNLLDYTFKELEEQFVDKIIKGGRANFEKTIIPGLKNDGAVKKILQNFVAKNNREIPVHLSGSIIMNDKGSLGDIVFIAEVATEEGQKLQKLWKTITALEGGNDVAGPAILIVDDDEIAIKITTKTLEKNNITVLSAKDGKEAIEIYEKHATKIKIIMLDINMPNMDGYQAFAKIRELNQGIKVIFCSGKKREDALKDGLKEDFYVSYMQKPLQPETLVSKLAEMLSV